ncbi:MAG: ABC transporter permease [Chloroflexi bacterium]|nr:ABC transporter permease [Chloroflexota bacterium]
MLKRLTRPQRPVLLPSGVVAQPNAALASLLRKSGALVALLAVWQLASVTGLVQEQILPPPLTVLQTFVELSTDWSVFALQNLQFQLVISTGMSLLRVAVGLTCGVVIGVVTGYLVAWYPLAAFPLDFLIRSLRTIPGLAWVPLAVVWFGVSWLGPIFIVTLSATFPIALATIHGVRTVNPTYIQALRTLGANDRTILREVILPGAVPSILTGVRVGMNIGWWSVIAAEMFGAAGGLGFLISFYGAVVKMPEVMAGMVAVGVVGFMLDQSHTAVQRRLLAWQGPRETLERGVG